jgi:cytosine/adenosine deaminase-related metal-dependent hydrolase
MLEAEQIIEADLTYVGDRFMPGVQVVVGGDGCIAEAGVLRRPPTQRLRGRALLPGFVSAHSHAFQRALRGLGETYGAGAGDFWTWRDTRCALVERLTPAELTRVCRQTFDEMLAAGVTTVGEFHYLHHADADACDFALDEVVLKAAAGAGIRLVLLVAYYRRGGAGSGAAALGARGGTIESGRPADMIAIDLDHISLAGWTPETLPECLVFSSGAAAVREVCVGGVWHGPQRAATS